MDAMGTEKRTFHLLFESLLVGLQMVSNYSSIKLGCFLSRWSLGEDKTLPETAVKLSFRNNLSILHSRKLA